MSVFATDAVYAEIGEPSSSKANRSSKLVRKDAIRLCRSSRKPPLPPVHEVPDGLSYKYATSSKKLSRNVAANVEDGTSISDDLETDTRSSTLRQHRHQRTMGSLTSSSALATVRIKSPKQSSKTKLQVPEIKVSSDNFRPSESSDSGVFPSASGAFNESEIMRFTGLDKQDMLDLPIRLHQLISMYQSKLIENEELIKARELEVGELRENQRVLEEENDALKQLVDELRKDYPIDIEEWKCLREHAELVLEENDSLSSQLKLLQAKMRENHVAHRKQVSELMQKFDAVQDQNSVSQAELKQLRVRFEKLREDYNLLLLKVQDHMPKDEHSHSIRQSKRLLEDLKDKYENDVEKANEIIKRLHSDKSDLVSKLASVRSENEQLTMENEVLITMHKKDLNTMRHLRRGLSKYKNETISLRFKLKAARNQIAIIGKEKSRLSKMASLACEEVNGLLIQIESASSHEARIKYLLARKMSLLDELQRQVSTAKLESEDKHQIKRMQHNLDETKRRLRKLKEKTEGK